MNLRATLANTAWLAASAPASRRFTRALTTPEATQWSILRANLQRNAHCAYGRTHEFGGIRSYDDFVRRVPIANSDDLAPWISRIRQGDSSVLTCEPVTRLLPTSGSSGARKLIPFTASLQAEFTAAVSPWIRELFRRNPSLLPGPAYWSVTPLAASLPAESSAVPIGFDDDRRYLGGAFSWLVAAIMATPSAVRQITDLTAFRHAVLLSLLANPDLRLISVWHPSFLSLLLDALPRHWEDLLRDLSAGSFRYAERLPPGLLPALQLRPQPQAATRLRHADPTQPQGLWPALRVVSCWAEAHARSAAEALRQRLPQVSIQPKGLLATEAVFTVPFAGTHPLAVCSHFYEFSDASGNVLPAHALRLNSIYETIVTTGGGLWRYRLGDQVQVSGYVGRTPTLRFLGRSGRVSDRCGEKLSETFVAQVMLDAFAPGLPPPFAMLAPAQSEGGWHYCLYLEGNPGPGLARQFDSALRANPHYALCRALGQLGPVQIFPLCRGAYEIFVAVEMARGAKLGDIKPTALSLQADWSPQFAAPTAI